MVFWWKCGEECADPVREEAAAAGFLDQSVQIEPEDSSDVLPIAVMVGC
jgi:hypothetical protein